MIQFENVTKNFGSINALNHVSFKIEDGEFVFLTGASGAGKTTILKMILRDTLPDSGKVPFDGTDITDISDKEVPLLRQQMGIVFQDFKVLPERTVTENVEVALAVADVPFEEWSKRVNHVLRLVGLTNRAKLFPSQLSGGELQRVSIARALVINPKLIIADEPTGNLDWKTAEGIMELLEKINKEGKTIIMATHHEGIIKHAKHRILHLDDGKIKKTMNIHTKTAFDAIKRSPFQAISATFVLALTFFVATTVSILVYASNKSLSYFETRPQIISFLKNDTSEEAISALQNKLSKDVRVKDLKYVSKEEALGIYKKATEDNPLLAELVSPSIFPASIEFSVTDLSLAETVIEEVKSEAIVEQVGFTANIGLEKSLGDVVGRLKSASYYLRIGGAVFVAALGVTSFLVLLVIISMRMTARKGEIEILSLIGATPAFVRSPIVIEGIIYSLLGVVIGWTISFISWLYISPSILSYFGQIPILPREPLSFFLLFLIILGVELLIGFTIALTGSLIAVKRSLKKTK